MGPEQNHMFEKLTGCELGNVVANNCQQVA